MRAPASISACTGGRSAATFSSTAATDQPVGSASVWTTRGLVRVASILASSPCAKRHSPISSGSSDEGVPEKAMRVEKSISPPRSCPLAESFEGWCAVVSGSTTPSR